MLSFLSMMRRMRERNQDNYFLQNWGQSRTFAYYYPLAFNRTQFAAYLQFGPVDSSLVRQAGQVPCDKTGTDPGLTHPQGVHLPVNPLELRKHGHF